MKDYKIIVAKTLAGQDIGLDNQEIFKLLETPPERSMGDYAFPCFTLAKTLKKDPKAIAKDLESAMENKTGPFTVKALGPYLNFYIDKSDMAKVVLEEISEKGESYGSTNQGEGKTIIVEYSSTNIAKPFHIGHIRTTLIGNSIKHIYEFTGHKTIAINYLGDYGTQFGMMIAAYKEFGDRARIEADPINELLRLYVDFNGLAEKSEEKMDEARYWFKELEEGNEEAVSLWQWFKGLSLNEFEKVYDILGVDFDSYKGEAFSAQFVEETIKEMEEKNLLVESDGAKIVDLENDNLSNVVIIKSDGTSTYIVRDIATAIYRKKTYDFDKNIYVVASQQNLHFEQLFTIIKKMGYEWAEDCLHVNFGMVSLKDMTLSTRKGQVVFLEDVLKSAVEKTKGIINERNPDLENKEQVAKQVGVGAVVFQELSTTTNKDYVFDWDNALNFDGETGPYVQYTIARANSILNKYKKKDFELVDYKVINSEEESLLISELYSYPGKIQDALEKHEPSYIARQLIEIAKAFNKFYNACPILSLDDEVLKESRLAILKASRDVLKGGLKLLSIESPEKM